MDTNLTLSWSRRHNQLRRTANLTQISLIIVDSNSPNGYSSVPSRYPPTNECVKKNKMQLFSLRCQKNKKNVDHKSLLLHIHPMNFYGRSISSSLINRNQRKVLYTRVHVGGPAFYLHRRTHRGCKDTIFNNLAENLKNKRRY